MTINALFNLIKLIIMWHWTLLMIICMPYVQSPAWLGSTCLPQASSFNPSGVSFCSNTVHRSTASLSRLYSTSRFYTTLAMWRKQYAHVLCASLPGYATCVHAQFVKCSLLLSPCWLGWPQVVVAGARLLHPVAGRDNYEGGDSAGLCLRSQQTGCKRCPKVSMCFDTCIVYIESGIAMYVLKIRRVTLVDL